MSFRKLRIAAVLAGVVTALLVGNGSAQATTQSTISCKPLAATTSIADVASSCGVETLGVRWQ